MTNQTQNADGTLFLTLPAADGKEQYFWLKAP
jgi:hypothetical protein